MFSNSHSGKIAMWEQLSRGMARRHSLSMLTPGPLHNENCCILLDNGEPNGIYKCRQLLFLDKKMKRRYRKPRNIFGAFQLNRQPISTPPYRSYSFCSSHEGFDPATPPATCGASETTGSQFQSSALGIRTERNGTSSLYDETLYPEAINPKPDQLLGCGLSPR